MSSMSLICEFKAFLISEICRFCSSTQCPYSISKAAIPGFTGPAKHILLESNPPPIYIPCCLTRSSSCSNCTNFKRLDSNCCT
uniref:Uncharacterized protein n=1 Tax=Medicago truncatula TaxID=3880 RepID=I3SUU3_MEDTR|nr:unknown [Medicago truncatula]